MEGQFTHNHYYIPEFYNKVLKIYNIAGNCSESFWSLNDKIEFLKYVKNGWPIPPIILNRVNSKEIITIDGYNRCMVIHDFIHGGFDSYLTRDERYIIEKMAVDVYISDYPLMVESMKLLRNHFDASVALVPVTPTPVPTPAPTSAAPIVLPVALPSTPIVAPVPIIMASLSQQKDEIKIISTEKKITIHQKTKIPKKQINEALKTSVWNKYIGADKGTAPCYACRTTQITQREFDTGHVVPEIFGGETNILNLRPICRKCNLSMGAQNMDVFIKKCFPHEKK